MIVKVKSKYNMCGTVGTIKINEDQYNLLDWLYFKGCLEPYMIEEAENVEATDLTTEYKAMIRFSEKDSK